MSLRHSYPPKRPGVHDRLAALPHSAVERTDAATAVSKAVPAGAHTATQARRKAEDHGLIMCSICEEPIRGLTCYRAGQACHFGCQGAARGDTLELDRLKPCHLRALENVREATRHLHEAALPRLRERMETLGFRPEDADKTLAWIKDQATIIIHVDLARFGKKLAADTHYRNQFETGSSGGCLSADTRTSWEADLFGDAYDDASPFDRCKYGVLNVTNDPQGVRAAHSYGSSYLLLRNVRLRTTFSAKDSGGMHIEELATVDYYAHVLEQYEDTELRAAVEVGTQSAPGRDSNVILNYKEAQIHGEVCLAEHVELIMANPSLRGERHRSMLEGLANTCHAPVVWMEGRADPDDGAVTPTPADSDDEAPASADLGRSASTDAALSREEEELARAIEASRCAAAEARALETDMESAEARDFDQAVKLSEAIFAEEAELQRRLAEEDTSATDLAMAISATDIGLDFQEAYGMPACHPGSVGVDLAARQSEAQKELDDELLDFAAACGDMPIEPYSSQAVPSSKPLELPRVEGVESEGAEDAELAAAIKASMEAVEEAKRLDALEVDQMARVLEMSSGLCDMSGEPVEDDELAQAIRASLASAGEAVASVEPASAVERSEPLPLDSTTLYATMEDFSTTAIPVVPAPAATTSCLEPEVEHVLKLSFGDDTRRLRSSWRASASPGEILARIMDAVQQGFGWRQEMEYRLMYEDEDGDRCTLAEPTVQDFLDLKGRGTLRLFIEAATP